MTHVYNTTYVCCIQIQWDHRGCDRPQASPDTVVSVLYSHLPKAKKKTSGKKTDVQPSVTYLLCALHPSGPRWCCSGHSEISHAAARNPRPARQMMPWWAEKAQFTNERRNHRQPRSPASSGGADLMWLDCCSCSSWSPIRSSAGEIHYARSIMPPSGAARKPLL